MRNDNRPVIDRPDFDRWGAYSEGVWENLSSEEKAMCLSYARALDMNKKIRPLMLKSINKIHEKHPDFHVGHIPTTNQPSTAPSFKTMDFSNYLPEVN